MAKRVCLFCGSDEKLTSSHVIGKRLLTALPGTNDASGYLEFPSDPEHKPVARVNDSDPREYKPNSLCATCNNIWMEGHENTVAETLVDLAKGNRISLDDSAQKDLALWATIACMVRGSMAKHGHISKVDRLQIRARDGVPEGYCFWIIQGENRSDWPTRFQWGEDLEGNKGWVGWLWIGQAIFVVASPLWAMTTELSLGRVGPYRRHLALERTVIEWPLYPESFLTYEEFHEVSSLRNF